MLPPIVVYALDPGSEQTGWVWYDPETRTVIQSGTWPNDAVLDVLHQIEPDETILVIERMKPRGMPTAAEEMRTLEWFGAFAQAAGYSPANVAHVYRDDVKMHLCGQTGKAKDPHVRRALLDRWGGDVAALGGGKCGACNGNGGRGRGPARVTCPACAGKGKMPPGPLAGVTGDAWAALGVAVTWCDREGTTP